MNVLENLFGSPEVKIFHATEANNLKKVQTLLQGKPELVHSTNSSTGETLLHLAAKGGSRDMVELLLACQATVNAKDQGGRTPLHEAAALDFREIVELLLAHHADVNAVDQQGQTPLRDATFYGNDDVVAVLRRSLGHK